MSCVDYNFLVVEHLGHTILAKTRDPKCIYFWSVILCMTLLPLHVRVFDVFVNLINDMINLLLFLVSRTSLILFMSTNSSERSKNVGMFGTYQMVFEMIRLLLMHSIMVSWLLILVVIDVKTLRKVTVSYDGGGWGSGGR